MRNIKLTIEYDGTNLKGWQVQPKGQKTVQGEIIKAAKRLLNEDIKLIGSGRTDSGVHALGQVANFKTKSEMPLSEIQKALNALLHKDIRITKAEEADSDFHSQYDAKRKTYRYAIWTRETTNPFTYKYSLHFKRKLNIKKMKEEALTLIGEKDFRSFMASDPALGTKIKNKNTVRNIYDLKIKKSGHQILIDITANGFLYKMVRNIVGTLLEIGIGKLPTGSMKHILQNKNRSTAGETAKANGLTLLEVTYKQ